MDEKFPLGLANQLLINFTKAVKMNQATITLQITISSKTVGPKDLQYVLSNFGGKLTAQIYERLRENFSLLLKSQDFETDWSMQINMVRTATPGPKIDLLRLN
jgi:hypothetical protein